MAATTTEEKEDLPQCLSGRPLLLEKIVKSGIVSSTTTTTTPLSSLFIQSHGKTILNTAKKLMQNLLLTK